MTTTWILRQNPCGKTDQSGMMEFIKKERIITCPYGHIPKASDHVDRNDYNNYDEDGATSKYQDRRFIEDIKNGDIVVIPFNKGQNPNVLIVKVESDGLPSKNFKDMVVVYKNDRVVKITPPDVRKYSGSQYEIKYFRPVYRRVSILRQVPLPEKLEKYYRSLVQARDKDILNWVAEQI
jgi:hypothetical protein